MPINVRESALVMGPMGSLEQAVRLQAAVDPLRELRPLCTVALINESAHGSPRARIQRNYFHRRVWRPSEGHEVTVRASPRAATLLRLGVITDNQSPKLVQMLLGHHSAAFTMDVYSDLWPMALDGIGERIAATLFSGVEQSSSRSHFRGRRHHTIQRASHRDK